MSSFEKSVTLPVSAKELFAWHERQGAFERLCPPWDRVEVIYKDDHISDGAIAKLKVRGPLGVPLSLEVIHEDYQSGVQFVDRQVSGPFAKWRHTHSVSRHEELTSDTGTEHATLRDSIEYKLPLGILGEIGGGAMTRSRLAQLFHYRHELMAHDLSLHQGVGKTKMHIAISGATGLIGSALKALCTTGGHQVTTLSRKPGVDTRVWANDEEVPDLSDVDVVIHLAGENIAQRWSASAKRSIRDSRVNRTSALAREISRLKRQGESGPSALICASGVGYYGDRGDEWVDESSSLGTGFLAEVCEAWEAACQPAREVGVRVVNARVGVVLTPQGGALAKLLLPFSLGLGGPVASGEQFMSWISINDVVGGLYFCAMTDSVTGPINLCAPTPVKNKDFGSALGSVLTRPALLPAPAFALKVMFGEMAEETILSGQRVKPQALMDAGYPFLHHELEDALRFVLGKAKI